MLSLSLLSHWYTNSNICSLSFFEAKLRNMDYTETYMHKLISPIYDISETTLSKWCYIIVIITMSISIYKIYKSPKTYKIIDCVKNISKSDDSFMTKLYKYIDCISLML